MVSSHVVKCSLCKRRIQANHIKIECSSCNNTKNVLSKILSQKIWKCEPCLLSNLPFYNLDNIDFHVTLDGRSLPKLDSLKLLPDFSIQTLLDKISGAVTIETDEFLSDSIDSKYYKPEEFIAAKIPKKYFFYSASKYCVLAGAH